MERLKKIFGALLIVIVTVGLFFQDGKKWLSNINTPQSFSNGSKTIVSSVVTANDDFLQGNIDSAAAKIIVQLENDPENGELYFLQGQIFEKQNDFEQAAKAFEKAAIILPNNINILIHAGYAALYLKNIDKAMVYTENGSKIHPDNPELLFLQAQLAMINNTPEIALIYIDNAIMYDRVQMNFRSLKAQLLMSIGQEELSLEELKKMIEMAPKDIKPRITLINFYQSKGRTADVQIELAKIIELHPEDDKFKRMFAFNQELLGDRTAAEQSFRNLITDNPNNYNAYIDLAKFFLRSVDYLKTAQILQVAIHKVTDDNELADTYANLSYVLLKMAKLDTARKFMEKSLAIDSNLAFARLNQAKFLLIDGNYSQGKEIFMDLLQENDQWGEVYLGLAYAGEKLGELDKDIDSLVEQGLYYMPNDPEFILYAAERNIKAGKYTEAKDQITKSVQLIHGRKVQFFFIIYKASILLGDLASIDNDIQKSISIYENLIKTVPTDQNVLVKLCKSYISVGNIESAQNNIEAIEHLNANNKALNGLKEKLSVLIKEDKG